MDIVQKADGRQKIAVVGSGISGLSAAWGLSKAHDVTLIEKNNYLGGHTNSVDVHLPNQAPFPVDTGFIVYNVANYPNLVAFLNALEVETCDSDMSFGVSLRDGKFEYSGQTLSSVFATRSNLISPHYWRMLVDITRFHRLGRKALNEEIDDGDCFGDFISRHGFGAAFVTDFIQPMAGAIWSTPFDKILDYPTRSFLSFYANHGLLQVFNMPVWRTIRGGARSYVQKIEKYFIGKVHKNTHVTQLNVLQSGGVDLYYHGKNNYFDQVIIATHGDQALSICGGINPQTDKILNGFSYQPNRAVLHCDPDMMPRRRNAWSAWNVLERDGVVNVTYWMNKLQPLPCDEDIFVTLNPVTPLKGVIDSFDYEHPIFDQASYQSQKDIWSIQGRHNIWFCGAHLGSGFHEDGIQSGLAIAEAIGGFIRPWEVDNPSGRLCMTDSDKLQERLL